MINGHSEPDRTMSLMDKEQMIIAHNWLRYRPNARMAAAIFHNILMFTEFSRMLEPAKL